MSQAQERRDELKSFRQELYRDHPEAEQFQRAKGRWLSFMLLFCLAVKALKAAVLSQTGSPLWALVLGVVLGLGMNAIFLAAGMGPQRRLAWVLYLWGGYNLVQFVRSLWTAGVASAEDFLRSFADMVRVAPLAALSNLLGLVYIVLILLTALWLTALPKNRRLAAEAEPLEEQWRKRVNTQSVN